MEVIAAAAYCGSLLVAITGAQSRWHHQGIKAELAKLRAELDQMSQAESRRLVTDLNNIKPEPEPAVAKVNSIAASIRRLPNNYRNGQNLALSRTSSI
jgi:hypothetical protein